MQRMTLAGGRCAKYAASAMRTRGRASIVPTATVDVLTGQAVSRCLHRGEGRGEPDGGDQGWLRPLSASRSSPVVCADETVEQFVAKCGRALVVHVRWLQHPQSANKPAIATHENREALGPLWYPRMALVLDLGSIPLAGVLDLSVRPNPGDFQLQRAKVDGRLDVFATRRLSK
jgi:hypothetical protein